MSRAAHITARWAILAILLICLAFTAGCSPTFKYVCPPLSPPPGSTIDALEAQGKKDPATAAWVIDLDRHYQKLDQCAP